MSEAAETTESPVDPKSTTGYRLALGSVIFLGFLIIVGVGVLIVGLIKGWGHKEAKPEAAAAEAGAKQAVSMELAPGFRILSHDVQAGRLILHVRSETIDEYDIIDLEDGRVVARIHAEAPK